MGGRIVIQFSKVAALCSIPISGVPKSPIFPHLYKYCHHEFLAFEYVA